MRPVVDLSAAIAVPRVWPVEYEAGKCELGGCREAATYTILVAHPRRSTGRDKHWRCARHAWALMVRHTKPKIEAASPAAAPLLAIGARCGVRFNGHHYSGQVESLRQGRHYLSAWVYYATNSGAQRLRLFRVYSSRAACNELNGAGCYPIEAAP